MLLVGHILTSVFVTQLMLSALRLYFAYLYHTSTQSTAKDGENVNSFADIWNLVAISNRLPVWLKTTSVTQCC